MYKEKGDSAGCDVFGGRLGKAKYKTVGPARLLPYVWPSIDALIERPLVLHRDGERERERERIIKLRENGRPI